jgi:hypothetical protein
MKRSRKIALALGKINTATFVSMRNVVSHKKMHLLFGIALAISLICWFDGTETIFPIVRNTTQSDSVTSHKNAFLKKVKMGNHEFVIFLK